MSLTNTPSEYIDRFDPNSNWIKVLFKDSRFLQSGELIELQSIIQNQLKRGFDSIYKNGSIIKGLIISIESETDSEYLLSISEGEIYINGLIIKIDADSISVPKVGLYNIGILFESNVINEFDDFSLRDPNTGGTRYGTEGAHRLIVNYSFVINNEAAVNIARISNGALYQKQRNPYEKLEDILANYIYDKSGNFCVNGLNVSQVPLEKNTVTDTTKYKNILESLQTIESEYLEALNSTNESKEILDNFILELEEAKSNYQISPSESNLINVNLLQDQVDRADSFYERKLNVLQTAQSKYLKIQEEYEKVEAFLIEKVRFSIEPGIAYILGKRVNLATAGYLDISKELGEETVDSAVFTYSGSIASTVKTLSLGTNITIQNLKDQKVELKFDFNKILYKQEFSDISITFDLSIIPFISIDSLLDFIVLELNKLSGDDISNGVDITSATTDLPKLELRNILKSNLIISKNTSDSLLFEATSLSLEANQIEIITRAYIDNIITSNLEVDIPSSTLTGASRNSDFQLGFRPVKEVLSVVADLEDNQRPIIRGQTPGTADVLGDDSIFRIVKVNQGSTTFIEDIDYTLINQSELLWLEANEPAAGTTYFVTYIYTQPLGKGTDYILDTTTDSIVFVGQTPARNQTFRVTYTYYLSREGIIYLDSNGLLNYVISNSSREPISPKPSDDVLPLAKFRLYKDSVDLINYNCKAFSFEDIRELIKITKTNLINLEKLKLSNNALLSSIRYLSYINKSETEPLAIESNNYSDLEKIDLNNSESNFAFSFISNLITTNYTYIDKEVEYLLGGTVESNINDEPYFVYLGGTPLLFIEQEKSSSYLTINKIINEKARGKLFITDQYSFSNKELKQITACDYLLSNSSLALRNNSSNTYFSNNLELIKNQLNSVLEDVVNNNIEGLPTTVIDDANSLLNLVSKIGLSSNKSITIHIEDLIPNTNSYKVYVGGIEIKNFTLINGTNYSNIDTETIRAKDDGTIDLKLNLPDLNYGSHTIEIKGPNGYAKTSIYIFNNLLNHILFLAARQFNLPISTGLKNEELFPIIKGDNPIQIITINNDVLNPGAIPYINSYENEDFLDILEPIHQSFSVPIYCHLTRISLKFRAVSNDSNIKLILREVIDGIPQRIIHGIARLDTLNISSNASLWSNFNFDYPIILSPLKEYCFSIYSEDENYDIFVSKINEPDINTGIEIGDQLYLSGDLYLSKDGIRFQRVYDTDLTYRLYVEKFNNLNTTVSLGNYTLGSSFNSFCLNIRDIEPAGTNISYEYRELGGEWKSLDSNLVTCLNTKVNSIKLRATLNSSNELISPYVLLQGATVSFYESDTTGSIISTRETYTDSYSNAVVYIQVLDDEDFEYKVYIHDKSTESLDWVELTKDIDYVNIIDAGLSIKEYRYIINGTFNKYFTYKIEFSSNNINKQPIIINSYNFVW